ncbi:hypothetical protein K432DRAFT_470047 [Lepidopterella palustris CBS 459.81]|uniref:Uncharacterized protein n=1 Tax=Lepidopterella palustris CBS 459.81 TaxID=1314670 RepID=A0A8E2EL03_9PEZI|nr:hypothetical protein K432DRAFT_470047 [Lepidopterella palustris CBS 459.81]
MSSSMMNPTIIAQPSYYPSFASHLTGTLALAYSIILAECCRALGHSAEAATPHRPLTFHIPISILCIVSVALLGKDMGNALSYSCPYESVGSNNMAVIKEPEHSPAHFPERDPRKIFQMDELGVKRELVRPGTNLAKEGTERKSRMPIVRQASPYYEASGCELLVSVAPLASPRERIITYQRIEEATRGKSILARSTNPK